jgi:hypothetical protein
MAPVGSTTTVTYNHSETARGIIANDVKIPAFRVAVEMHYTGPKEGDWRGATRLAVNLFDSFVKRHSNFPARKFDITSPSATNIPEEARGGFPVYVVKQYGSNVIGGVLTGHVNNEQLKDFINQVSPGAVVDWL